VMSKGHSEQVGSPDAIYDHPETPFVFDFIGQSLQVPVTVRGGRVFAGSDVLPMSAGGLADGAATLFSRPQDVVIARAGEGLAAEVVTLRRSGPNRLVEVSVGPEAVRMELVVPSDHAVAVGDRLRLAFARPQLFAA